MRWRHPTLGEVSPAEFIPLLENSPLARPLTDWVSRNAVAQAGAWQRKGLRLCISVNISATNLEEADFAERLLARLDHEALPRVAIELEITESALISNDETARAQLEVIMGAGVKLAIDDFGTGYSTLSYLQQIPAHTVKIDRSFITRLDADQRGKTLVKSMINMAHDLGYSVVAEGVETEEAYQLLALLGCDEIQGYLIAKPLPVDVFEVRLDQKTSQTGKNSVRGQNPELTGR